ncbi:MAG: type IV pili methyl-accepting chemotaxis transducer N-terminal domain-containing protein [Paracoccaceae bacterium]
MKLQNVLAVFSMGLCLAGPAIAENTATSPVLASVAPTAQDDAETRIRTSVKIKLRAQSISAAACHLKMGMNPDALKTPISGQIAEFEKFVNALVEGDPSLGIAVPEARKLTHRAAQRVTDAWVPVKAAAQKIALGDGEAQDIDQILAGNLEILEEGHNFTAELVQQYANPAESTLADLFTVVIATRQGMLSQKISKESCMVTYAGGSAKKLGETMSVFENTLYALRDGLPGTGIEAAPTEAIAAGLSEALEQWYAVRTVLQEIQSGADVAPAAHADKMAQLDALKVKMLEVSTLYVDYLKEKRS